MSWQHLRLYQDVYRLLTVHIQGFSTGRPAPWPDITLLHILCWPVICPILLMPTARLGSDKSNILKSLVWLDWDSNFWLSVWEACTLPIWPLRPFGRGAWTWTWTWTWMCYGGSVLWGFALYYVLSCANSVQTYTQGWLDQCHTHTHTKDFTQKYNPYLYVP